MRLISKAKLVPHPLVNCHSLSIVPSILDTELGSGTYGTVYKALEVSTGNVYAAKVFNSGVDCANEVQIMKSVTHVSFPPFVIYSISYLTNR